MIRITLLLSAAIFIFSCSKEETLPEPEATFRKTQIETVSQTEVTLDSSTVYNSIIGVWNRDSTIEITGDTTGRIKTVLSYPWTFEFKTNQLTSDTIIKSWGALTLTFEWLYNPSDNRIIFYPGFYEYKLFQISSNMMVLKEPPYTNTKYIYFSK